MKAIYFSVLASGSMMALAGCSGLRLSDTNALADDVYYDGEPSDGIATAPASKVTMSQSDMDSYDRRVASYSSGRGSTSLETRDFSQIQQYYANAGSTNGVTDDADAANVKVTEVSAENPESGYWVDGFSGSDADQSYAERIIRFHRPLVSVNYYSPFFQSARMSGDWNIYIDGFGSTYMVPTWTNPWYDDFYYGGLAYDWRWGRASWYLGWNWGGWGFGWASDWGYWAWGGWGWPHHHHGWCDPWGMPHHYHGHHDPWHGGGHNRPEDVRRPVYASRANTVTQTYSGTRQRELTTNPNAARAAQRYRQELGTTSRVSRSYMRDANSGYSSSARTSDAYRSNARRGEGAQLGNGTLNGSQRVSSASSNTRRSSSAMTSGQPSRSSYTPSYGNSRGGRSSYSSSERRVSTSGSNSRRSSSTSSYAPSSRSQQRPSYSGTSSSRSSSRQSSSFSGGGRSSGSFSGGSRSSGGGARSGGRPR